MNPRVIILVVIAGLMSAYLVGRGGRAEPPVIGPANDDDAAKKTLGQRDLAGTEPPAEPDLAVTVEVDHTRRKNRLFYNITESHGYYVEEFRILTWYKMPGVTGPDDSPVRFAYYINDYLKANETFRTCTEVVPAELSGVGGDMGTSENWDARIVYHGRAREKNPDPLPVVVYATTCD